MNNKKHSSGPKVSNGKTIRSLSRKMLNRNKSKSMVIIIAIALCSFMFATLFTVGINIILRFQESTMRQVGSSTDCSVKYLNEEEYALIKNDDSLKEVSRWIYVGEAVNKELLKLRTEVHWTDSISADKGFELPEVGSLPDDKSEDEISVSSLVLNALGYNAGSPDKYKDLIGEKITLSIDIGDKVIDKTFKISGIHTGDRVSMSQVILVSKAFQDKYVPTPKDSYYGDNKEQTTADAYGRIDADVDFKIPVNIKGQIDRMIARDNLPENVEVGSNWASVTGSADYTTTVLAAFLLLIIFASGYLIINNVYRINIYSDIRSFGLLKTIGFSGKQLKALVKWQSVYLAVPGIIVGLVFGIIVGSLILPLITRNLVFSDNTSHAPLFHPLIIVFAAVFSYVTVRLSVRKSMKIASKVSPIEAVRFMESGVIKWKKKKKNASGISSFTFALRSFMRDKKKAVFVILSLSLSLVIMNTVYSMISGFDEDKYVESFVNTDFSVSDATLDNPAIYDGKNLEGITDRFMSALNEQKGIAGYGNVYIEEMCSQDFTDEDFKKIDERLLKDERLAPIMSMESYPGSDKTTLESYEEEKSSAAGVYGMDDFVLNNLTVVDGSIDTDKLKTGKYVIATAYTLDLQKGDEPICYFKPKDIITVNNNDGEKRQYEVMAVVDIPYAIRLQMFTDLDINYIFSTDEFNDFFGERDAMRCIFNADSDYEDDIEEWISDYTGNVESNLKYSSRQVYRDEFKEFTSMFIIVGGLITVILALIGILNLTNTLVTSIMSRRVELAMLEAVGETKNMQKKSICLEGVLYALFSGVFGILFSALFSILFVRPFGAEMWFFEWHFTLTTALVVIPVMLLIAAIIPYIIYNIFMKSSVVERLRLVES